MKQHNILKVFIAGSKSLEKQRTLFRSVLSKMQNLWKIMIEAKTFEDFSGSLTDEGRQEDYNNYINKEADIVAFVFDSTVGGITLKEFKVAYDSFKENQRPEIYVYCKVQSNALHPDIEKLKNELNNLQQYYIDYNDENELVSKFKEDINRYFIEHKPSNNHRFLKFVYLTVTVLILGITILYLVHQNQSEYTKESVKQSTDYMAEAKQLTENKNYTEALKCYQKIKETDDNFSTAEQQIDIIENYYIKKELFNNIIGNQLAVSTPDSLFSAKKYLTDINMCATRRKLPQCPDSLLQQILYKEFERWIKAGDNSTIESVKERCYNTAKKLVE